MSQQGGPPLRRSSTTTRYFISPIAPTDECWPVPAKTAPRAPAMRTPGASLMPPIRQHTGVSCVAFRPDGRKQVTAWRRIVCRVRGTTVGDRQRPASRPSLATRRRSSMGRLQPGWFAAGDGQRRPDGTGVGRDDGSAADAPSAPSTPGMLARLQFRWPTSCYVQRGWHRAGMGRQHR